MQRALENQEREIALVHHKTGVKKSFILRPFRPGDEDAVMKCVSEEYGDTYYRREYYDKELLSRKANNGGLFLFLAYCGDDVCGIQSIISHDPSETRLEAASQIFRKDYRGYGLPYELVKYTYEAAKALNPSCIYASTVVFHDITQRMCEEAGMVPVAFNLGSHLTSRMHNSFSLGSSEKYAQAILILPVGRKDAGEIYIHPDIASSVRRLYEELGVGYNIVSDIPSDDDTAVPEHTELDVSVNEREQSVSITVSEIGSDLIQKVREVRSCHDGGYWTMQLILPTDRSPALRAYEELVREGFFYAGIRPLCSDREQIFMQYTGGVRFCFDEYKLTDRFRILMDEIIRLKRISEAGPCGG